MLDTKSGLVASNVTVNSTPNTTTGSVGGDKPRRGLIFAILSDIVSISMFHSRLVPPGRLQVSAVSCPEQSGPGSVRTLVAEETSHTDNSTLLSVHYFIITTYIAGEK